MDLLFETVFRGIVEGMLPRRSYQLGLLMGLDVGASVYGKTEEDTRTFRRLLWLLVMREQNYTKVFMRDTPFKDIPPLPGHPLAWSLVGDHDSGWCSTTAHAVSEFMRNAHEQLGDKGVSESVHFASPNGVPHYAYVNEYEHVSGERYGGFYRVVLGRILDRTAEAVLVQQTHGMEHAVLQVLADGKSRTFKEIEAEVRVPIEHWTYLDKAIKRLSEAGDVKIDMDHIVLAKEGEER